MKTGRVWMASRMLGTALLALAAVAHAKSDDQAAIKALEEKLAAAISAKDIDRIMSFYETVASMMLIGSWPEVI